MSEEAAAAPVANRIVNFTASLTTGLIGGATIVFFVFNTAFVSQREFVADQKRQDAVTDSLFQQIRDIGCLQLTREQMVTMRCPRHLLGLTE